MVLSPQNIDTFGNWVGNTIDKIGTKYNLNEKGVSEFFAGGPTVNTVQASEAQPGDYLPEHFRDGSIPLDISKFSQDKQEDITTQPKDTGFNKFDKNANPGEGWGWHGSDGGWKPEGGSSGSGGPDMSAINAAYDKLQDIFGEQSGIAQASSDKANQSITDRFGVDETSTLNEKARMLRDIGLNKQKFEESGYGALDQNIRDYNALEQRANVRYGGGSSVGQLMRELAAKELYRSQGGVRKQQLAGQQDFANQLSDTELFIGEKMSQLKLWRNEALDEVQTMLSEQLNKISVMKGELGVKKEEMKLEALQTAQANAQLITQSDKQFKNDLMSTYITSMSETMGRTLTPEEVQNAVAGFNNINLQGTATTNDTAQFRTFSDEEDELAQTNALL